MRGTENIRQHLIARAVARSSPAPLDSRPETEHLGILLDMFRSLSGLPCSKTEFIRLLRNVQLRELNLDVSIGK